MKKRILEDLLSVLEIDSSIVDKLRDKDVLTIEDLWRLKRKDLKEMGFKDSEIMHIIIKLQLYGLDLNKKSYGKD